MARRGSAKREAILAAAELRFARYGFRRTSMEDIALEAGISRAGLYLEFPNKEEIFTSASRALLDRALAAAAEALESEQPLEARLRDAVLGKNLRFVELLYGSPHGAELMDEKSRLCGDQAVGAEKRFRELVARAFRRAAAAGEIELSRVDLSAAELADLFAQATAGLMRPGVTADAYRGGVAALVRVFIAGLARTAGRRRG
jgi:AcrR family transcriptional regulator